MNHASPFSSSPPFVPSSARRDAALSSSLSNGASSSGAGKPVAAPVHRGVNFGFYARNGYYSSETARQEVDRMAQLNVDWVCVIATVMQDSFSSTRQYRDFKMTPADDELREIIDYIHGKGMHVQLRPMLECWDGSQRGDIRFPSEGTIIPGKRKNHWTRWFASMEERTLHYARLARRAGCEAYGLDSELDHTTQQNTHWKNIVAAARSSFTGHLTTGHTLWLDILSELDATPDHWFRDLDSLGVSFYPPLVEPEPGQENHNRIYHVPADAWIIGDKSFSTMLRRLEGVREHFTKIAASLGKPFYLAECGCCSAAGASSVPYRWDTPGGYDGEEQARFFEAIFSTFWDEPWWMGFYLWKWDEQNDRPAMRDDPRGDKGFTVWGKPAAETLRKWFTKNRTT
ncbi:MAG: hypothetical protein LBK99_12825 [Opitutaceae bacterium]|jgi:hypothetical protein|nr:hypothetical protein [Opitutaceae bacterium]